MIVIAFFVLSFLVGVPIVFILGGTGLVHILTINPEFIQTVPQKLFNSLYSFSLLAIPLFILAGELMGKAGSIERICNFARSLLGHIKGGLAYVMVFVGCILGISVGSASASASLLGSVLYPELRKDGYEEDFSSCLVASAAVIGPILPPGIYYIIYGVAANASIKSLFLAGIIPGLLIAAGLCVAIAWIGRKKEWPVYEKATVKEVWKSFVDSAFAFVPPILTLICIMSGICTPTEGAAVLCVFVYIAGRFVYRKFTFKDIVPLLSSTCAVSGAALMITAMGGVMGFSLAMDQIPTKIASVMLAITDNKLLILLILNILLLIVGCLMDGTVAIIILVPVLLPVIKACGIDVIHFGFVMCYNLAIGLLTPPVGATLYVTAGVTKVSPSRMSKAIWPWIGVLVALLMLFTYVPALVTFIPNLLK